MTNSFRATGSPSPAVEDDVSPRQSSSADQQLQIQFWGVRGNIPSPGADTVRYGGNTACVEVLAGEQRLIFDGGTGLRILGKHLCRQATPVEASIFFTHTHWDRIQGFPFFLPAFSSKNRLDIYGAVALNGASIKQLLTDQMLRPNFFIPLQTMQAEMTFHNIAAGHVIELDDVSVETISLNPHTNALGYRVNWRDYSLVYATDTDPTQKTADPNLMYLAQGANVLIFDGTYADTAYIDPDHFDSAPWKLGIQVAKASDIDQLVLFHHNPCHDDDYLDKLEQQVQAQFPKACLAREGMAITIDPSS
jgi:phosphoribosyl 1,2-cyclic phosphodiesterase